MIGAIDWCTSLGWTVVILPSGVYLHRKVKIPRGRPKWEKCHFANLAALSEYVNAPAVAA